MYTLDQYRDEPAIFSHSDDDVFISYHIVVDLTDTRSEVETVFAQAILMNDDGVTIVADYHTLDSWRIGKSDRCGNAIYVVPWDEIRKVLTEEQAETAERCMAVDRSMLANAR